MATGKLLGTRVQKGGMVDAIILAFGFATMVLILATIPPSVEARRREGTLFVIGVLLVMAGLSLSALTLIPSGLGELTAVAGMVAVLASAVPLLR